MAQDDSLEQLVIEMADTASEHAAVARHFLAKAEEARQEQVRHENMAQVYTGSKFTRLTRSRAHCERLAESYAKIAEQYEELAQLHEEEAKALEQAGQ